jgi:uncharacterized protein
MIESSPAFRRYVELARNGREQVWRLLVGCLIVILAWAIVMIAILFAGVFGRWRWSGERLDVAASRFLEEELGRTPFAVGVVLLTFAGIWLGVWIALRLLHKRSIGTLLGADRRLSGGDFTRGLIVALLVSVLSEVAALAFIPTFDRGTIGIGEWLVWLAPLSLLLFVQISAEEVAFRGYLVQTLAARFQNAFVWGVLPAAFFTIVHWDPAALPFMNATILISIASFAAAATILVYATGNLGAAMGVHFGMNFFGIMLVSHASWLNGAALFVSRPLDAGGWTLGDAALLTVNGVLSMTMIVWLLLARRSPLRLKTRD